TVGPGGITNRSHDPISVASQPTIITVTCIAPVVCGDLDVEVEAADGTPQTTGITPGAGGTGSVRISSSLLGGAQATLRVSGDQTAGGTVALVRDANSPPPPPPDTTVTLTKVDVGALLTRDCGDSITFSGPLYDARINTANFVVTPVGNVLLRPSDVVDENDVVVVHVVGDAQVVSRLAVTRLSEFRTPGQVSFVGQGLSLSPEKGADGAPLASRCVIRQFRVTDFAPGEKGEIQLALVDEKGAKAEVGKFDFGVHTLYSGAFSFGPVRTELRDPDIGTVTRSGKEIVTATEDGTPRVLYVLSFTPFMWGRRELEEPGQWYTHINPTISIVPAHVQDNAMLGLSIDVLNSFYLQGGVHAGRVRRLDTRSGLELGDEFTGTGDVPTVKEWDADWFVGLTVDLRAAVEFLKIAATGAGGG
ncbi:MAG TPA: hypothetical protein VFT45_06905, partial [Longimicrobium sp.]|nr:hypothetical protein [Longimicrobium sp.]